MEEETRGHTVTAVAAIFAGISLVAVALRLWARAFIVKSVGADDYLIVIAVLLAWAFIACTIGAVKHGLGSHFTDVQQRGTDNLVTYLQIVWLSSIFYNACLGFIKISALALYRRIGDMTLRRLSTVMIVVISCQAGANVLACIFQCTPVQAAYDIMILPEDQSCVDINAFYLANAAINIFTDILTYSLPIPLVFKLQIPRRQKISLGVILGLGLFACISSIIRITYIPQMLTSTDSTWVISDAMYWSVIEINVGILAASIPSYKSIAKRYAPRLLGTSSNGAGSKLYGFKMMGKNRSSRNGRTEDGTRVGDRDQKPEFSTQVKKELEENSSEEELVAPQGRIGVRTEISHQFEANQMPSADTMRLPIQGRSEPR